MNITTERVESIYAIRGFDAEVVDELAGALHHDLASTIAQHRGGTHVAAMASGLTNDKLVIFLVGLIDGCERAVFHKPSNWLYACPIDESGHDKEAYENLARGPKSVIDAFVLDQGRDFWDWVHPRYRWVFDIDIT